MHSLNPTQELHTKSLSTNYATKQTNLVMTNKLNLLAVEKYSKTFAAKICEEFFSTTNVIDGKQIVHLTSFQQVNLFTIKALYEKWQTETQRLRSPYFNYGEEEVQMALKQFMNVLSQHISVKRDAFEPMLVKATQETLWLALQPHKFFSETFRDLPNFRLTHDELNKLAKYVQINRTIIPSLTEKLSGSEFVFANQAIDWLDEIISEAPLEDHEGYLDIFSDILPVPDDLFSKKAVETANNQPISSVNDSFFDKFLTQQEQPQEIKAKTSTPVYEPILVKANIEPEEKDYVAPLIDPELVRAVTAVEELPPMPVEPPKQEINIEPQKIIIQKEPENLRLNDQLSSDQKTLNDQVTSGTTVLDLHKNKKIEEISHAISLNQRFLFINNLFNGNLDAYVAAIQELGQCQNFPEAKEVLLKKYVPKYLWDITSAEAEEFIDIVRRRFS